REARWAASLRHPNIVVVHSIEELKGMDFLIMEFIEGESLHSLIARGPLPVEQVLKLGIQTAEGLAHAHAAGIIHRDIKATKLMLGRWGQLKIRDCGLAKQAPGGPAATREFSSSEGVLLGTLPYMSPEQVRTERVDARTDLFSAGCVLYEAATGRSPFLEPTA